MADLEKMSVCLLGLVLDHITSLPLLEGMRKLWYKSAETFLASVNFYKAFVSFNVAIKQWSFIPYPKFVYCVSGSSDILEALKLFQKFDLGFLCMSTFPICFTVNFLIAEIFLPTMTQIM